MAEKVKSKIINQIKNNLIYIYVMFNSNTSILGRDYKLKIFMKLFVCFTKNVH